MSVLTMRDSIAAAYDVRWGQDEHQDGSVRSTQPVAHAVAHSLVAELQAAGYWAEAKGQLTMQGLSWVDVQS